MRRHCLWVVDLDLEKFFDRVNHDILMSRVAKQVSDKRVLGLIRRYLQAGVLERGVVEATEEGAPQGGAAIADVIQYFADRLGPGAGASGTPLRALCR